MEKKKILLVTVSVGIFLVIAIGTAILFFTPRQAAPTGAIVTRQPVPSGAGGAATVQTIAPAASGSPVYPLTAAPPVSPETGSAEPPRDALTDWAAAAESLAASQSGNLPPASSRNDSFFMIDAEPAGSASPDGEVVVSVPRPRPAAVPNVPVAQGRQSAAPAAVSAPAPAARSAPAGTTGTAGTAAGTARAAGTAGTGETTGTGAAGTARPANSTPRTPAAAAAPAQAAKTWTNYWVQAGSFTSRTRADTAKETLASKGITSIIENNEYVGKIWYRVRIGPYTSRNEADYWLALIQTLEGFEQSEVWNTPVIN
jgi:DedD protein